ncbi:hypothetical protein BH18ACI4_BH18ACI4_02200 [soil metagenome]
MRLTEEQQHTLRAAVDRIIPPDDYPGAWQCGVGDYLARQFESDLRPMLDDYCAGLSALEAESVARFQQTFVLLSEEEQDTMLRHIEAGEVLTAWNVRRAFFSICLSTQRPRGSIAIRSKAEIARVSPGP